MCFKSSAQCGFYKLYKKDHPCDMYHYKKYVDDKFIKWGNIDFPVGNMRLNNLKNRTNTHRSMLITTILMPIVKQFYFTKEATSQAQQKIGLIKLTGEKCNSHYV